MTSSLSGFEQDHDNRFKDEIFVKTSLAKSLVLDHITDMELQKKNFLSIRSWNFSLGDSHYRQYHVLEVTKKKYPTKIVNNIHLHMDGGWPVYVSPTRVMTVDRGDKSYRL